jgi:hypothetical protein
MSANDEFFKKKYETSYNFNKNVETIAGKGEIPPNVSPFEKSKNSGGFPSTSGYSGSSFGYGYGGSSSSNNHPSTSGYNSQKRY